jgi:esterase/lipase
VFGVGTVSTLRTWLSMWSLRTSQCTAAPHLARIAIPSLVVHATADACVYASDARTLYDAIAAPDKTLEFIKADHYLQEPDTARAQTADLITAWVTSHPRSARRL